MKFSRVTAAIVMASLSVPLLAASGQTVGKLTTASQGTFVSRDGKLIAGYPGQSLYAGDRVMTRGKATAKVAMSGCSYALGSTSILSVGKGACTAAPRSLAVQDNDDNQPAGETPPIEDSGSAAGSGLIAAAALVAVGLGVYVAVDENDSSPASP